MQTVPDIAGSDAVVGLGAPPGAHASWILIAVRGAGTVRVGGVDVAANQGAPVDAGASFFFPFRHDLTYGLDAIKFYIPTGATVSAAWMP